MDHSIHANPSDDRYPIFTLVHGQPEFRAAAANVSFLEESDKYLSPFGIVLENRGTSAVVAYSLQWIFDDGNGGAIVREQLFTQPFALNDGPVPGRGRFPGDVVIAPGNSRFVTPVHNLDLSPGALPPAVTSPDSKENMAEFLEIQKQRPFKEVRLASYVLADGSCFGAFKSTLCVTLQAQIDAVQDVLFSATKPTYNGNIEEFINSFSREVGKLTKAATRSDEEYDTTYTTLRDAWTGNLTRQFMRHGYDKTLAGVRQRIYQNRPAITITR
jgi:hypothetical protein